MSRRPTTRTTRLPPLLAALRLHDQCTRALCLGPDAPGIRTELASIRAAWRDALAALTDAFARDTGNTLADVMNLNLAALRTPLVARGSVLTYYT
jgi:hypothetical protein